MEPQPLIRHKGPVNRNLISVSGNFPPETLSVVPTGHMAQVTKRRRGSTCTVLPSSGRNGSRSWRSTGFAKLVEP